MGRGAIELCDGEHVFANVSHRKFWSAIIHHVVPLALLIDGQRAVVALEGSSDEALECIVGAPNFEEALGRHLAVLGDGTCGVPAEAKHLERAHHVMVFVGHHVAVPDVVAWPVELHDHLQGFAWANPDGVLQAGVFWVEVLNARQVGSGVNQIAELVSGYSAIAIGDGNGGIATEDLVRRKMDVHGMRIGRCVEELPDLFGSQGDQFGGGCIPAEGTEDLVAVGVCGGFCSAHHRHRAPILIGDLKNAKLPDGCAVLAEMGNVGV